MKTNERYKRQIILKEFGPEGQQRLLQGKVLVVGAGGLGCPALLYLAAAGVGRIGIIDGDIVELTNLHRQVIYSVDKIGQLKAPLAAETLRQLNPSIDVVIYPQNLTVANAWTVIENYDIVIDGTDNFVSRYLINDACVLLGKTLVYGAVSAYEGQVAIFNRKNAAGLSVNYRDLFPRAPASGEVLNCAEAGVLGVLPGIIGTMQANETIKLITGIGDPLVNQLLTFNALTNDSFKFDIRPSADNAGAIPPTREAFEKTDYEWFCGLKRQQEDEIDSASFNELARDCSPQVIDVRDDGESPGIDEFIHEKIPLGTLLQNLEKVDGKVVVCVCQTGARSRLAVHILKEHFGTSKRIYSLAGGILHWKKLQQ